VEASETRCSSGEGGRIVTTYEDLTNGIVIDLTSQL